VAMRTGRRMSMLVRTWAVSTLVLLSCLAAPTLLQPLTGAPQDRDKQPAAPVFRTTKRLVQLNVIATDKKGEPVSDLAAADFVVLDNGRTQTIKFFRKETDQPPANSPRPLPPDTYTNQIRQTASVPASVTILLFDGLNTNISDQAYVRPQAIKFLQQIRPQDRLAVFTLARDLHVLQDLTGDSSKLVAALGKYSGQTTMDLDASTPADVQTGDQTMDALLQDAFQREANMYVQDRVQITVAALIDIANYVERRNCVWSFATAKPGKSAPWPFLSPSIFLQSKFSAALPETLKRFRHTQHYLSSVSRIHLRNASTCFAWVAALRASAVALWAVGVSAHGNDLSDLTSDKA
jgi:VWFA-related protein